jgi:ferredoxin-NADP reductase
MQRFAIQDKQRVGKNTLLLTVQPKSAKDKLDYRPGQYAAIGFRHDGGRPSLMRCFSIASSPYGTQALQFGMRIEGDFTQAVSKLGINDEIFLRGPFGDFVIEERYDRNVILMAGGIGITPFMSMIRYAAQTRSALPMTLLYSCRSHNDITFVDELLALQRNNPHFKVIFFVTDGVIMPVKEGLFIRGRINESRLSKLTAANYNRFTYFICGPSDFTKSLSSILAKKGTDPARIMTEEFTPSTQVENSSLMPRYSITRWTYGLTGAALVIGTIFIMGIDLDRALPRLVSADSAKTSVTGQGNSPTITISPTTQNTSSDQTSTDNANSSSTTTNPVNSGSGNNSSNSSQSTTTAPSQTYYQPVTSVS